MNKLVLDHIGPPEQLSSVVDRALSDARADDKPVRRLPRAALIAAVIGISITLLAVGAPVFAAVIDHVFSAIQGGFMNNSSRSAIISEGYVAEAPIVTEGAEDPAKPSLVLKNYYIDPREIGFDLLFSGANPGDGWEESISPNLSLELIDADGKSLLWEESNDMETDVQRRVFPGGHFLDDPVNNIHEYVEGSVTDFGVSGIAQKIGDDEYSVAIIISFNNPFDFASTQMRLLVDSIVFWGYPGIDDITAAAMPKAMSRKINGGWSFDVEIDSKFAGSNALIYQVSNPGDSASKGVEVLKFEVMPSACIVDMAIDYSKNKLADPNNINLVSEPHYVSKVNVMDTEIQAEADGKIYSFQSSSKLHDKGSVTFCRFELDSMYFDNADSIKLRFTERDGEVIELRMELIQP